MKCIQTKVRLKFHTWIRMPSLTLRNCTYMIEVYTDQPKLANLTHMDSSEIKVNLTV